MEVCGGLITTRVDPQTKKNSQEIAKQLGTPLSVIIKGFLKEFIRTKTINFSVEGEYSSKYLKSIIRQGQQIDY